MKTLLLTLFLLMPFTIAQSLREGEAAFLPTLLDSYGNPVDLAALVDEGHWLVLWFYPKAMTSGCSLQAGRYTALQPDFTALNAKVFGISADSAEEQCSFIEQLALSGQMIPDADHALARAYGVIGIFYNRDTILINPQGQIERIWRNVNPLDDADTVLEYLRSRS